MGSFLKISDHTKTPRGLLNSLIPQDPTCQEESLQDTNGALGSRAPGWSRGWGGQ